VIARHRARVVFVALAAGTIIVGLWVHRGGLPLGPAARDALGDALWAVMIAWWLGAVAPRARALARGAVALGICVAVELSQLAHTPALDAARRTTLGQLVLGSGFDPRDVVAYALGVLAAVLLERLALARRPPLRGAA
jgi:hypothetical protein